MIRFEHTFWYKLCLIVRDGIRLCRVDGICELVVTFIALKRKMSNVTQNMECVTRFDESLFKTQ